MSDDMQVRLGQVARLSQEVDRLRGVIDWWERVALRNGICTGCGSQPCAWKCCPDCSHDHAETAPTKRPTEPEDNGSNRAGDAR